MTQHAVPHTSSQPIFNGISRCKGCKQYHRIPYELAKRYFVASLSEVPQAKAHTLCKAVSAPGQVKLQSAGFEVSDEVFLTQNRAMEVARCMCIRRASLWIEMQFSCQSEL